MRLSRFATFWEAEGEVEQMPDARPSLKYLYETLYVQPPKEAIPYCYGINSIVFHQYFSKLEGAVERRQVAECDHYDLNGLSPNLLKIDRVWYEAQGGEVVWRNEQWQFRYRLDAKTRAAEWANGLGLGKAV
jgi:hypothetical protein